MLDARLEKYTRIGTKKSIAFVARWLSGNSTTVDSLVQIAKYSVGINALEVEPILWLFQSMGLIISTTEGDIAGFDRLSEMSNEDADGFDEWFVDRFITFVLAEGVIDTSKITYSISENAFFLSPTAIKPTKYAGYRNILIDYDVISLLPDSRYRLNRAIPRALNKPDVRKKVTEKQLLRSLEAQRKQGERGELFVLDYEKKRISDPVKGDLIQRISTIDVAAGFDIISLNSKESVAPDRFIEVKTYKGSEHFIWSDNEIDRARVIGNAYFLYLVDDDSIDKEGYEPIIIQNPVSIIFESGGWLFEPDSFRINRLNSLPEKMN